MSKGTWTYKFEATKPYKGTQYGKRAKITVVAGLYYIDGNAAPYWSVTAEIRQLGARDCDAGGMLHDEILAHWPELAPVIALHLVWESGEPVHAVADGWYWLAGYYGGAGEKYHGGNGPGARSPEECLAAWAKHVRVGIDEAHALATVWGNAPTLAKALHAAWCDAQQARWQAESAAAKVLIARLKGARRGEGA